MYLVVSIMVVGILTGYFLRERKTITDINSKLTMWMIYLLLFFLGSAIGHNESIMNNLSGLGLTALVISLSAVAGCLVTAWLLWIFLFKGKEATR
jgi:uncharacterized membrane protein YbjE (DUF340 family)